MTKPSNRQSGSSDAGRFGIGAEALSLSFHVLMLWSVIASMHRVDSSDRWYVLGPLATLGLILGFCLARTHVQDLFAHSLAVWMGALASILVVGLQASSVSEIVTTRGHVFRDLVSGVIDTFVGSGQEPAESQHVLAVLGLMAWLLAYSSAWVVYRRRWFAAGIGVPAAILLTSLRIDDRDGGWQLLLFVAGAIGLAARDAFAGNLQRWSVRRLPASPKLAVGFMAAAIPIALVTVLIAAGLSPSIQHSANRDFRDWVTELWSDTSSQASALLGQGQQQSESYTAFSDEWNAAEPFNPSNEIVALVTSDESHYLAVRRYDTYTGNGWSTNVESTFQLNGDAPGDPVTHVTFEAGTTVPLSDDVSGARSEESAAIRVLIPKGDLAFTIETFSGSDHDVQAIMGWTQINGLTIDVNNVDLTSVPIDLVGLIASIRGRPFTIDNNAVVFDDESVRTRLGEQLETLEDYPVTVDLSVDADRNLIASFTGRIPNYDDIEVVFSSADQESGSTYRVYGQTSVATEEQLASAGTAYPTGVTERYLQESDTQTDRITDLTRQIVADAGANDPFHQAEAIQNYLRASITYDDNPPKPPDGQDMVDFVLFDETTGRCEQYATAMVVMVRTLGIPARIVTGYNARDELNEANDLVYRENQVHAWVEVYFPGYGWIPFEPTSSMPLFGVGQSGETDVSATLEVDDGTPVPATPEADPGATAEATPDLVPPQLVTDDNQPGSLSRLFLYLAAIGVTLLIGVGSYMMVLWRTGLSGLPPAAGLYARLIKVGRWFGIEPAPSTTPGEFARAFSRTVPGTEQSVRRITEAYYVERYDPSEPDDTLLIDAQSGWKHVRGNLLRWRIRKPTSP